MTIIDRLVRNERKQTEFRSIVQGRSWNCAPRQAKRQADMFFLQKYAGLNGTQIAKLFGVSKARPPQIIDRCGQIIERKVRQQRFAEKFRLSLRESTT